MPSQASDVDQFLDDLFMPVLDGNIDDGLSDARSLAASMRGGGSEEEEEEEVRDGDEVQRDDVRPVDRDAGPTSGPTLDAKGVALWEKGVLACPAERFGYAPAGIFPLDLKVGERERERKSPGIHREVSGSTPAGREVG